MIWLKKAIIWVQSTSIRHEIFLLIGVFLLAILARLAFGMLLHSFADPPIYDEVFYDFSATKILAGEGYRSFFGLTAGKPPVYPFFIAGLYFIFGESNFLAIRLVQVLLDGLSCILIYLIGRTLSGKLTALIAGVVAAIYPLSVYMSHEIYPETVFLFLEGLMLLLTIQMVKSGRGWQAILGGVLFGLCMLARPNIAVLLPFVLVYPSIYERRIAWKQALQYALAVMIVLIPWSVRNYLVFNSFVPLTTGAGAVFWSDNHPMAKGGTVIPDKETWQGDDYPDANWAGWSDLSEPESNRKFMQAGLQWVRSHPVDFFELIPRKLGRLWSPAAFTTQSGRTASSKRNLLWIPYLPFLAIATAGVIYTVGGWRKWWIIYSLILATNLSAMIFSGGTRYSLPMAPALALLFAQGTIMFLHKVLFRPNDSFLKEQNV